MLKMKKRNYEIIGLTPKMARLWVDDFRDDLAIFVDMKTGKIRAKIALNRIQALGMRLAMFKHNHLSKIKHTYVLKLKRCKGTRCRV